MDDQDRKFMQEAIDWANACHPIKGSIPKVGAIIAVNGKAIGRGRRGTGKEGDDNHAEKNAFHDIKDQDRSLLPHATLYTTLEPCTGEVRTIPLECCTHLILQHQIKKVFVGMLDPNQGVTGKGLYRLQESGVEVALFPHIMAQKIRVQNIDFIRTQQTLGARIISPENGAILQTHKTGGKHTVRIECLNSPTSSNHLFCLRQGVCYPQPGRFRHIEKRIWEVDVNFGATGDHVLHIVTANDLGNVLVQYYQKVVQDNLGRRSRLKVKLDPNVFDEPGLLGGDYIGIQMNGVPKGFQSEASVSVTIEAKP
jgi:pyrimidine deaminase RibD-like protein